MGLRDFLKKARVEEETEIGDDEEGLNIDVGKAIGAIKELRKRKS